MAKKSNPETGLTDQQEMFCREYLVDFNGTQAAIRAGYSEKSAYSQAHDLLKNDAVADLLRKLAQKRSEKVEVKSDEVLREMMRMGYSDVRGIFNDKGAVLPMAEWSDDMARAIAYIEVDEIYENDHGQKLCDACDKQIYEHLVGHTKKIKLWPKDRAVEMLAKNQKLLTEKHEHSGPDGLPLNAKLTDAELEARINLMLQKTGRANGKKV